MSIFHPPAQPIEWPADAGPGHELVTFGVGESSAGWCPVIWIYQWGSDHVVTFIMAPLPSQEDAELWALTHGQQFAASTNQSDDRQAVGYHLLAPLNDGSN